MNENFLFYGFIISAIPYVIISVLVIVILKKEGCKFSIFNIDYSNYGSLKKIVKKGKKYRWLYIAYISSTFLPILVFILFIFFVFACPSGYVCY